MDDGLSALRSRRLWLAQSANSTTAASTTDAEARLPQECQAEIRVLLVRAASPSHTASAVCNALRIPSMIGE